MQGVLKLNVREAKDNYRRKLENKLKRNNMRDVWSGMRTSTGFQKTGNMWLEGRVDRANELNLFFNRFDTAAPLHKTLMLTVQQQLPLDGPLLPLDWPPPPQFTPTYSTPPPCSASCPPQPEDLTSPPTVKSTVFCTPDLV